MEHKHIDPEPDRRYLIHVLGNIESAEVIEMTDQHVRLKWDDGKVVWHKYSDFQPSPDRYLKLMILEQLEPYKPS